MTLAQETVQRISEAQLSLADRVLTGDAACEFNQTVSVLPVKGHPGHFHVGFKKAVYTMVRNHRRRAAGGQEGRGDVDSVQPSMLMNHRIGQRMVDACMHSEQTAAVAAVEAAARSANAASAADAKN